MPSTARISPDSAKCLQMAQLPASSSKLGSKDSMTERAPVIDLLQGLEEPFPGHVTRARDAPVVFAGVDVSQAVPPACLHRLREVGFLDIHVKGVQVHLHVARADVLAVLHPILRRVDEVRFETIHRLDADDQGPVSFAYRRPPAWR